MLSILSQRKSDRIFFLGAAGRPLEVLHISEAMFGFRRVPVKIFVCGAMALLAGCGGSPPPALGPAVAPDAHQVAGASWMSPLAKRAKRLLYVSHAGSFEVNVYLYNTPTLVGKLTPLSAPYGLCSNRDGDVWITEFNGFRVVEYAHGGTTPLRSLETDGRPIGCSVDTASGDLAVADFSTPGGSGDVEIFKKASGPPARYTSSFDFLYPPGYDDKGNLFAEGRDASGPTGLTELRKGGTTLAPVSFSQGIFAPSGVMWDGKYVAAADQEYMAQPNTAIYRLRISGYKATVVSFTVLTEKFYVVQIVQPWIQGNEVIGAGAVGQVCYWNYPAGGDPQWRISGTTGDGVTASVIK
jgi:hypothetical protein